MPFLIAGAYAAAAGLYILWSSAFAAGRAEDVGELQRLETWKGLAFVAVTTVGVYFGVRFAARRAVSDQAERVERELRLVSVRNQELAGVMAASVAHDANNVLVSLLAGIDALAAGGRAPALESTVEQLRSGVDKLVALNRRLLGFPLDQASEGIERVVRGTIGAIRAHGSIAGCQIVCSIAPITAKAHPVLLHQIVGNLVLNAGEATGGSGRIELHVVEDAGTAMLEVHDDGPGVPPARRPTLFAGFGSTKPDGIGLGLFSVRTCVDLLGGTIEVADSPLGGALFRVRLPLHSAVPARA